MSGQTATIEKGVQLPSQKSTVATRSPPVFLRKLLPNSLFHKSDEEIRKRLDGFEVSSLSNRTSDSEGRIAAWRELRYLLNNGNGSTYSGLLKCADSVNDTLRKRDLEAEVRLVVAHIVKDHKGFFKCSSIRQ